MTLMAVTCVNSLVRLEIAAVSEGLSAHAALKRLFPGVDTLVLLEVSLVRVGVSARAAFKRLFAGVHSVVVFQQMVFSRERFPARCAKIRPFSGVRAPVGFQVARARKVLVAGGAPIGVVTRVGLLMLPHLQFFGKALAAGAAYVRVPLLHLDGRAGLRFSFLPLLLPLPFSLSLSLFIATACATMVCIIFTRIHLIVRAVPCVHWATCSALTWTVTSVGSLAFGGLVILTDRLFACATTLASWGITSAASLVFSVAATLVLERVIWNERLSTCRALTLSYTAATALVLSEGTLVLVEIVVLIKSPSTYGTLGWVFSAESLCT